MREKDAKEYRKRQQREGKGRNRWRVKGIASMVRRERGVGMEGKDERKK